ncbi:unnamed protein product [Zymoseptoria tritici ST99CH_1E4]|uniref:histidine kinase n=1 Tax=Zymoseptoria tritici ST99CH_1E4 TaxID=1276532 RepID=A0A2H1FKU7_ZYMTR|nr:unnamed protein product [Zymoseptoria tritici ST99CH_1E4]
MRIPIRVQLGSIILLASLVGLAVISIATWIFTHNFVLQLRVSRLEFTASLKAAQISSNLDLYGTSATTISTRVTIQNAFQRYYATGNNTIENWLNPLRDIQAAISSDASLGQSLLLQARLWDRASNGLGSSGGLLNVTADGVYEAGVLLPGYLYPNGSAIPFGANDTDAGPYGYPPPLYPNLTYFTEAYNSTYDVYKASYGGRALEPGAPLLLGPWSINSSFSLMSLTVPVTNNTNRIEILGHLTVVLDARLIYQVTNSLQGLGKTGETLLLGPAARNNHFNETIMTSVGDKTRMDFDVQYIVPVNATRSSNKQSPARSMATPAFNASQFPVIYDALALTLQSNSMADVSGGDVRAKNEAGEKVSVGYALLDTSMVDWIVVVSMSRKEVWQPINTLRNVIITCLFATAALMAVFSFGLGHFASLPIIRLKQATLRSMDPPSASRSSFDSFASGRADGEDANLNDGTNETLARKEGLVAFSNPVTKWRQKRGEASQARRDERQKRVFRIPGKVKERKHWAKDELSELTEVFNSMSDELMMQYTKLEERVQQRTAELELSKKAAEAANESKTLFIANLSHELKTPLNGILGLSAVCMQEDDPLRLKRSLGIIYKSGDLLLNLLTDLLTFSKNQVGQHITLDEKEFRLRDISSQILAIFEKQAREGQIDLRVEFEGAQNATLDDEFPERNSTTGPTGIGRLRDLILWGDIHRLLQVVINLISNALKFSHQGGSVVLTVRCLPEIPDLGSRTASINSRPSRHNSSRQRASASTTRLSTANAINAKDKPHAMSHVTERAQSPPPGRYVYFEFSVADTGPGIPESMQDKIFEPFVQGDLGLSKKYGGTGLGLSICSQLASLMRGTIRVQSTIDVGSTFTMKVPLRLIQSRRESSATSLADGIPGSSRSASFDEDRPITHGPVDYSESPTAEIPPAPKVPTTGGVPTGGVSNDSQPRLVGLSQPFFASSQPMESPGSQPGAIKHVTGQASRSDRIRVLVAEDNKVNQEVVLRMLKLEDIYDVTVAKDGQEALDLVKESMCGDERKAFNLIFMDVQMPNVDGLQSTRLIREIGYQAPIVALTAFAEESNIQDCLDSGMNYFLSKPIRRPQLKKVLREYCAPIPEENEEATTPVDERRGSTNTTIVMVNGPSTNGSSNGHPPSEDLSKNHQQDQNGKQMATTTDDEI